MNTWENPTRLTWPSNAYSATTDRVMHAFAATIEALSFANLLWNQKLASIPSGGG
jgi:hypothetical protein